MLSESKEYLLTTGVQKPDQPVQPNLTRAKNNQLEENRSIIDTKNFQPDYIGSELGQAQWNQTQPDHSTKIKHAPGYF